MSVVMDSIEQTVESWRGQGISAEVVHEHNPEALEHSADLELTGVEKDGMQLGRYVIVHPDGCDCAATEPETPPIL